jgi:hypothetical protein
MIQFHGQNSEFVYLHETFLFKTSEEITIVKPAVVTTSNHRD